MLYLVRKHGESIIINDNIEVKVMEIKGKSVKLGFSFPPSATVLRKELHDRIVEENQAAQRSGVEDGDAFADVLMQASAASSYKDSEVEAIGLPTKTPEVIHRPSRKLVNKPDSPGNSD